MAPPIDTSLGYLPRVADDELDRLLPHLAAISIDGAKAVGKTETARRRALTLRRLDDPAVREVGAADPGVLLAGEPPVLLDEWQRAPEVFDLVRRAVDDGAAPGSFLLTGSSSPSSLGTHSGAGRIVRLRMRPLALFERFAEATTVSIESLLAGRREGVAGGTAWGLVDYVAEIVASGLPGLRGMHSVAVQAQLDGYLDAVVDRDFPDLGHPVRNPASLRRWLVAYAAATSTAGSFESIRDAATGGHGDKPSKTATMPYRDVLERLYLLEPVPAWRPTRNRLARLGSAPKHQLADPAFAARLLGVDAAGLLDVRGGERREGVLLGQLFEALVTLSVRVAAQAAGARVGHLRTHGGQYEVDLVVERPDGRVLAIEVKLSRSVSDDDVRSLRWLADQLGDDLLDVVVVTTGPEAYRRADGIAVVPAALLGC
jgi:predicted AAA+ superfamily ATPase